MLASAVAVVAGAAASGRRPDVGAVYFGDWHVNAQNAELHGPNWTEWEVVLNARPKFPGHSTPRPRQKA